METGSEFGKGFIYNLVLFAEHRWQKVECYKEENNYSLWLYCAADHLFELEIPKRFRKKPIGIAIKRFRDDILDQRLANMITAEQVQKMFDDLDKILIEIDKYFGIDDTKATWG